MHPMHPAIAAQLASDRQHRQEHQAALYRQARAARTLRRPRYRWELRSPVVRRLDTRAAIAP